MDADVSFRIYWGRNKTRLCNVILAIQFVSGWNEKRNDCKNVVVLWWKCA